MYVVRKTKPPESGEAPKKPFEIIRVADGRVIGHASTKQMAEATVAMRLALEGPKR